MQGAALEIDAIDVRDLALAACRRLQAAGDVDDVVVVEVEAGHGVRRSGVLRLFLEADGAAGGVEFHDPVTRGVAYLVGEHGRSAIARHGPAQAVREMCAVEDVVAQRQRDPRVADELAADGERFREAAGMRLFRVRDREAEVPAVAQQPAKAVLLMRRGNDQHVPYAREHQRRQRVVHHRLVVDGDELLAHAMRHRMQPRSGAPGENDAFHRCDTPSAIERTRRVTDRSRQA